MVARHEALPIELDRRGLGLLASRTLWRLRRRALLLELALCLTQGLAPARRRAQVLGQLIAAGLAIELVLAAVGLRRLLEELAGDLRVAAIGVERRVRRDLRRVDRDDPDRRQARPRRQPEHAREQLGQDRLMAAAKVGDRRIVGDEVAGHDPVGDVLYAGALDPARRPIAARVGVEQERHDHRWLVGRPAVPVGPIGGVAGAQIEL
jgi:hypothetical protein